MEKQDLKPLFVLVRLFFVRESSRRLQSKGILFYLKALRALRGGVQGSLIVFHFLQTIMLSFLCAVTAEVFLAVEDQHTRLLMLLGFFSFLFVIPFIGVAALFSEKLWYRASGAEKMVEEFTLSKSTH
ncbi:MAG: hypothetical protein KA715_07835 [Xanthomonadaceae bacterium]|nr:hypothetical protein [Xanthomonadaceae bacterium]